MQVKFKLILISIFLASTEVIKTSSSLTQSTASDQNKMLTSVSFDKLDSFLFSLKSNHLKQKNHFSDPLLIPTKLYQDTITANRKKWLREKRAEVSIENLVQEKTFLSEKTKSKRPAPLKLPFS